MNKNHYAVKENEYFSNVRMDIISLVPLKPGQKILEIGAGGGNTLVYIKENNIASEVMGVELMKIENSNQINPVIDKFQVANIEQDDIDAEEEYFDIIICADVLEHLNDPWTAVNKIQKYLKKNGLLIVSIPNIREWKTLFPIIFKGEFNYQQEGGIMDKTHLRFFCKKNMYQLLKTSTLSPIFCKPNFMMKIVPEGKKRRIINILSFRLFEDFLAVQYLFIAKKN
jgi:2-polyprenyl-3-methyl-5-hydroxy-6-metoxy-1,4-benzoquinol methylase